MTPPAAVWADVAQHSGFHLPSLIVIFPYTVATPSPPKAWLGWKGHAGLSTEVLVTWAGWQACGLMGRLSLHVAFLHGWLGHVSQELAFYTAHGCAKTEHLKLEQTEAESVPRPGPDRQRINAAMNSETQKQPLGVLRFSGGTRTPCFHGTSGK